MAEVEYGGIKIGGSKLLLILPLIGTLGGGLWAGFEFYKDYMDMKEQIEEYVAPDMSGLEEEMAVLKETIESSEAQLQSFIDIIEEKTTSSEEKVDLLQNELQARIEGFEKEIEIVIKFEENLADQAEDARTYTKSTAREIKDEMHIMDGWMEDVDIINHASYTGNDELAHTMFGPWVEMIGDTVTISFEYTDSWYKVYYHDQFQVILKDMTTDEE